MTTEKPDDFENFADATRRVNERRRELPEEKRRLLEALAQSSGESGSRAEPQSGPWPPDHSEDEMREAMGGFGMPPHSRSTPPWRLPPGFQSAYETFAAYAGRQQAGGGRPDSPWNPQSVYDMLSAFAQRQHAGDGRPNSPWNPQSVYDMFAAFAQRQRADGRWSEHAWQPGASGGGGPDPAAWAVPPTPLVAMKPGDDARPFFCVHALFGSVFPYFKLASIMGPEHPFYAIQSPALTSGAQPKERMEDLAKEYVELVRSIQPNGPYFIGGYSFGSWVAYEMAQQLARAGEEVALLAMIGTSAPPSLLNPPLFEFVSFYIDYARDFRKLVLGSLLPEPMRKSYDELGQAWGPLLPFRRVLEANCLAELRYRPTAYPGRITVLTTLEQRSQSPFDPSIGWKLLSVEDVETIEIGGNHLSLFQEPNVADLAAALNGALARARSSASAG